MMGETYDPGHWSVDMEVNLFHAMRGHKPVGVNRHFNMLAIYEKLSGPNTKKLTAKDVWNHLSTMYDLQALNDSEIVPFPNKQVDFKLPNGDYTQLTEADFPRMQNVGTASTADSKSEGQAKGGKSSRSDSKTPQGSSKGSSSSSKTDSRSSTPASSKQESRAGTPASTRSDSKAGKGGSTNTPDPSPKRTKRTRNTPSAASSPSDGPSSAKRRR